MVYAAISDVSKEGIYFGQMGNWKGRIRRFFDLDQGILERFEVVWPRDVADMITGPKSDG